MNIYDYYITPEEYEEAKKNGISYQVLNSRIRNYGWSKKRAMTEPVKKHKPSKSHKGYAQQAIDNNIPLQTYYSRVERGMSKQEASTKPIQCKKQWAFEMRKRIKRKYPDWVYENMKKHKISYSTFRYRVHEMGWSLEKASTTKPMTESESARLARRR